MSANTARRAATVVPSAVTTAVARPRSTMTRVTSAFDAHGSARLLHQRHQCLGEATGAADGHGHPHLLGQHDQDQCGGRAPGGVDGEVGVRDACGHEGACRSRAEVVADERLDRLELGLAELEHAPHARGAQEVQAGTGRGQRRERDTQES